MRKRMITKDCSLEQSFTKSSLRLKVNTEEGIRNQKPCKGEKRILQTRNMGRLESNQNMALKMMFH
jgi:hypothetical protein